MILSCYFPVYPSPLFEYQYFFFFIHYSPYGLFIIFLPLFFSFCFHRLPNLLLKLMARFYITFPAYTTLQPLGAMSRRARRSCSIYAALGDVAHFISNFLALTSFPLAIVLRYNFETILHVYWHGP